MTPDTPLTARRHNWRPTAKALRADPGTWYKLPPGLPSLNPWLVRRGAPAAFSPDGSFDARANKAGTWLVFLGEPTEPWRHYDDGTNDEPFVPLAFDELERAPLPGKADKAKHKEVEAATPTDEAD